ncbi:MAG: hypothetical protein ACOYL3_23990 [Desulfuromonadaceae bacterium]
MSHNTIFNHFVINETYALKGDVTTLDSIMNLSPHDLELRLGYEQGRLSQGYFIFFLVDTVDNKEFYWGDQTIYSGRWQFIRDIEDYAQREDVLRYELLKQNNFDESKGDNAFDKFMQKQQNNLNVRQGSKRIVKIIPVISHDKNKPWYQQYPNAALQKIPQWTINKPLKFICYAFVQSGDRFFLVA